MRASSALELFQSPAPLGLVLEGQRAEGSSCGRTRRSGTPRCRKAREAASSSSNSVPEAVGRARRGLTLSAGRRVPIRAHRMQTTMSISEGGGDLVLEAGRRDGGLIFPEERLEPDVVGEFVLEAPQDVAGAVTFDGDVARRGDEDPQGQGVAWCPYQRRLVRAELGGFRRHIWGYRSHE